MGILSDLQPKAVMHYFEEICSIPHGSLDTKRISDYCVRFAEERGLRYIQDDSNNVVIFKDATVGYEDHPTVILQGHLDMVCEKDPDCDIDFSKDGLRLCHDGEYIFAKGTTLGGDDGIAVAYALALLDDPTIPHPPLEVVITVDEEFYLTFAPPTVAFRSPMHIRSNVVAIPFYSVQDHIRFHIG